MGVTVEHLTKKYKRFELNDITFDLPEGYILGVAGRNGSGKSTLFHSLLFGECEDGGSIEINKKAAGHAEERRKEYRRQCAFILEDFPFPLSMNAVELGKAFGPFYDRFDEKKYRELLKRLELPEKKKIQKLSAGMKLKVQMAFAFSCDSRLLVMDEPTANLDSFARKDLYNLLYEYMEPGNRNVIWATHLTEELDRMADYLLFLEKGKQTFFGEKETLLEKYRVLKAGRKQMDCMKDKLIGRMDRESYSEGLVKAEDGPFFLADSVERPNVEQLILYLYGDKKKSVSEYAALGR